jgi:hypothetical protein
MNIINFIYNQITHTKKEDIKIKPIQNSSGTSLENQSKKSFNDHLQENLKKDNKKP